MITEKGFCAKLKTFLIFAGPTTFVFLSVVIIPFLFGIYLSLTNWDGIASAYRFIGLQNYLTVFRDQLFWKSFFLTLKYVFSTVVLVNVIAFVLAYLLTRGVKGENFYEPVFLCPI